MTLRTGRIIRRIGLLMEAAALFGIVAVSRLQLDGDHEQLLRPSNLLAIALGIGFFVWALGTGVIYRARVLLKKRVPPLEL